MPTLGTQNISDSYHQLLKTFGTSGLDGNLQVITDGDNTSSAFNLSTTGIKSTGTLAVDGTSLLSGIVTFGTSLTASTGTATIGTLSASTATISTATISTATISTASFSTATIPLQLGAVTFGSHITASTGTATIATASISTASISTATISTMLGAVTFGSTITASTGTNTFGTNSVNYSTVGTTQFGASGPKLTAVSFGTAAFTASTVSAFNNAGTTNGTFALTGCELGDMVIGSLNSLGTVGGSTGLIIGFHPIASNVARYSITNPTTTAGTVPAGTIFAAAMRFTA